MARTRDNAVSRKYLQREANRPCRRSGHARWDMAGVFSRASGLDIYASGPERHAAPAQRSQARSSSLGAARGLRKAKTIPLNSFCKQGQTDPNRLALQPGIGEDSNTMRTDLDHLPDRKRRDLHRAVQVLFAEFEDATRLATQKWKKQGRILKVILYGSHARGDWVDDPVGGYVSDYDLLVVVSDERLTDTLEYWAKADDHLTREVTIAQAIGAPVNFIVHSLADVNDQLARGRPFFVDIANQGIALYEADGHPLDAPRPLTPEAVRQEAQAHFDQWFSSAAGFLDTARYSISKARHNEAAFLLHQAAERFYHTTLLVHSLYSPKSHKLNFLRSQAENAAPNLITIWPRDTKFAQRCFELLRQAYVNARYSKHYRISVEELEWISERIEALSVVVEQVCRDRIVGTD
ncbi:HEPN domain-containing protein [Sphingomonas sp. CJ99]